MRLFGRDQSPNFPKRQPVDSRPVLRKFPVDSLYCLVSNFPKRQADDAVACFTQISCRQVFVIFQLPDGLLRMSIVEKKRDDRLTVQPVSADDKSKIVRL